MSTGGSDNVRKKVFPVANTCHLCKYFYITWDKKFPYGCHAMSFKSYKLPSIEVREIEGKDCVAFESKKIGKVLNKKMSKSSIKHLLENKTDEVNVEV
ncbi:MAG: hypothetical protein HOF66_02130 [Nitrosomonadaceae bacterium]|jgi:hypothetical protein|nr:hypothetical protein [Nitrosomonadaceae bacterium]